MVALGHVDAHAHILELVVDGMQLVIVQRSADREAEREVDQAHESRIVLDAAEQGAHGAGELLARHVPGSEDVVDCLLRHEVDESVEPALHRVRREIPLDHGVKGGAHAVCHRLRRPPRAAARTARDAKDDEREDGKDRHAGDHKDDLGPTGGHLGLRDGRGGRRGYGRRRVQLRAARGAELATIRELGSALWTEHGRLRFRARERRSEKFKTSYQRHSARVRYAAVWVRWCQCTRPEGAP